MNVAQVPPPLLFNFQAFGLPRRNKLPLYLPLQLGGPSPRPLSLADAVLDIRDDLPDHARSYGAASSILPPPRRAADSILAVPLTVKTSAPLALP